jgi:probable addiction module antidote protein
MANSRSCKEELLKDLQDVEEAANYLTACLEDYEEEVFLIALRDVVQATLGMSELARQTQLNREGLYTMLSEKGHPQLSSVRAILDSLGYQIVIRPVPAKQAL